MRFKSFSPRYFTLLLTLFFLLGSYAEAGNLGEFSYKNTCKNQLGPGKKSNQEPTVKFETLKKVLPGNSWLNGFFPSEFITTT